jgi:glycosyltransferase involved in cell wall biosynthesis
LQAKYSNIELIIAGDGDELDNVKSFVHNLSIPNVFFRGYIEGEEKKRVLESSHILCFPSYGEGMPNVVIESMAFGLPVVTRSVGGIPDFFINEKNGFMTTSKDPHVFAHLIEKLLINEGLYKKISLYNYQYAKSNFMASQAALRLEKIYKSVLMNTS